MIGKEVNKEMKFHLRLGKNSWINQNSGSMQYNIGKKRKTREDNDFKVLNLYVKLYLCCLRFYTFET